MEPIPVEPKKRSRKPVILALLVVIVIVAVGVGLYFNNYYNGPCGVNVVKSASDKMKLIAQKWDDATQLASSTSRIALSGPVSQLQASMRDVQNLEIPSCMTPTRDALRSSMESTINGFVAFMGQKADSVIQTYFSSASVYMDSFGTELLRVSACAPNCQ